MIALGGIALLAWLYLAVLHGRFWQAGPVLAPARPVDPPRVAVVVPARDEAALVADSLGSLLAQDYLGLSVTLVDDGSADGTGDRARALADPRLTVLAGAARPPGWAGKLWAVQQGVAATDAPWLLLTDADIVHDPRHLATLVAHAEAHGLDMVSEMVRLRCACQAERWLVPAFVYFFQLLYPFGRVNDPASPVAAAAGGTVLIRRAALERAGGIEAIRTCLIDDVALAARVKKTGRIWLGHSDLAWSVRPYPAAADVWRMVARSAYVQLGHSPWRLLGTVLSMALLFVAPLVGGRLGIAAFGVMMATFLPTLARFGLSPLRAVTLPGVALFYVAATIGSAASHHLGRGVVWKRRAYAESRA